MAGYGNLRSYSDGKGGTYTVDVSKNPELSKTQELDKKMATKPVGPAPNQPSQFDLARKRAAQQNTAQTQQIMDAMKRRQAQMGGGPRGAFLKQEQIVNDQSQKNLAEQNEGIDVAEAQEAQRQKEIAEGREFQKSERVASQEFATKSQLAQQQFQQNQQVQQNAFQQGLFDREMGFKEKTLKSQDSQFARQMNLAMMQYKLDEKVTNFNMEMANMSKEAEMGRMRGQMSNWWNKSGASGQKFVQHYFIPGAAYQGLAEEKGVI